MPLELRKQKNGTLRSYWYGRFTINGRRLCVNLGVKIEGMPPASLLQDGDKAFERSRAKAQAKLEQTIEEARSNKTAEQIQQTIHEIRYGARVQRSTPIANLIREWEHLPRRQKPSKLYAAQCSRILRRFIDFMRKDHPETKELASVRADQARTFLEEEENRGVTPRTWNVTLTVIRAMFRKLEPAADAYRNYLANLPTKRESTIHREPFTPEELKAVIETSQSDEILMPLILTAVCTAMRRGDCALLKWSSVDMKSGFITVKTSKTGETVDIPILPMLMEELRRTQKTDSEYVFPVAAKMYRENPDNLNVRLRAILAQSGFVDAEIMQKIESVKHEPPRPLLPPDETRRNGLTAIDKAKMTESKRARMREIFRQYMDGQTVPQIAEKMGISKGIVSMHLNEVAGMVGAEVIRRPIPPVMPHKIRGNIHKKTDGPRLRRANVKGWHSFRTTWITLALSAGLPMELVRRVSGHTTTDVVLKHYFRPGREQFRQALQAAMPKLLMNGTKSRDEQLREIITGITSQTWKENKKRALELLGS